MLHDFLAVHQSELEERCRTKAAARRPTESAAKASGFGVPLFITQLIETLRRETIAGGPPEKVWSNIGTTAGQHGEALLREGYTIAQVVNDYGDLCQSLTELAHELTEPISVEDFRTFNRCLDGAIAEAVTSFSRVRDSNASRSGLVSMNERLGSLAHELRNQLNAATLAFLAIKGGGVAVAGATGALLERSLGGLRSLIDHALSDVRMTADLPMVRENVDLADLVEDVRVPTAMEAEARGLVFTSEAESALVVDVDRQMLASAVANLLQNAMKFTRPNGSVFLTARAVEGRAVIAVEDQCGGLPHGDPEQLFVPFAQLGAERSGIGLGLSISRRSVEANGGTLTARDLPGTGCVFAIELPRLP